MTEKSISAAAISRILKSAGIKKAFPGKGWSTGFTTEGCGPDEVLVWFDDAINPIEESLEQIVKVINAREDHKYFARVINYRESNTRVVSVVAHDGTDPQQNDDRKVEALEELAAEHPAAPQIKDVRAALLKYSHYAFVPDHSAGYLIERYEDDTRLVRVAWRETSFTTYGGDKEKLIASTLANYHRVLVESGFEVKPADDDEWSLLVAMPGEWDNKLTPETVTTVLRSHYPDDAENGAADLEVSDYRKSGFKVRTYRRDNGALRVEYYASIHESASASTARLVSYARILERTGYSAQIHSADEHALVVRLATPQDAEQAPAQPETAGDVLEALETLRRAMRDAESVRELVKKELGI